MATTTRNFLKGRMNKALDKRLVPDGEYTDALNIRLGATSESDIGSIENSEGNTKLVELEYNGVQLNGAKCIGSFEDGANETIYWFIHQPSLFGLSPTGKIDIIVSYNALNGTITYHVVSTSDPSVAEKTSLDFNTTNLITAIDLVDDLLFFTDNFNPPRRINIKKSYPLPSGSFVDDALLKDDILVVKAPPINSPSIQPQLIGGEENFLEERFICFAYRYRYEDNEYSATSSWSAPSFIPNSFQLSSESYLNEGMINSTNSCQVTFNAGNALVKGIDLLFKEISNNTIKVIEKFDKENQGYADNTDYQYTFTNSKIYTVLPSEEILRTYDNVPLLAKAQTMMGNRLMFGNYVEGWDLIDLNNAPLQLNYQTLEIRNDIGLSDLTSIRGTGNYTFGSTVSVANSVLSVDLSPAASNLVTGSAIEFTIALNHSSFALGSGATTVPTETTQGVEVTFLYVLTQNFNTITDLFNSDDFQSSIGTVANIEADYSTFCDGITFTDLVNCALRGQLTGGTPTPMLKYKSGISAIGQPISATHTVGTNIISFQFPAMEYVNSQSSPTASIYEYYSVEVVDLAFQKVSSPTSLHSNRGYEIGMVYMDEFSRATTALTSVNNTAFFSCSDSLTQNKIQVTIPVSQVAPYFATRYKFVIKPDAETYDTIYSSLYFYDPVTAHTYFLVEGENAAKSQEGTRLIVKRDVDGPLPECVYATVLDKTVEQADFILVSDTNFQVPSGVYLKMKANDFNATLSADAVIAPGLTQTIENNSGDYPILVYEGLSGVADSSGNFTTYSISTGSRISFKFKFIRKGTGDGDNNCERRIYEIEKTFTASQDYTDIIAWWEGDNIQSSLNDGTSQVGDPEACDIDNVYVSPPIENSTGTNNDYGLSPSLCTNFYRWFRNTTTNEIRFIVSGTRACGSSNKKESRVRVRFEVIRAENLIAFETEPTDASPDIWYESSETFAVDALGNHSGNVTNQDISNDVSGVITTNFFNCFSFGNGVESYKVRDSLEGRPLALGNRVTSVSAQDYKEAHRDSDITYSGIYNNESNVNKLNEFNLALVNFKALEESFGPIQILYGRETDILTLQEDKISYVLTGKNLLSDSTGGGSVSSIPEVLGTQIARVEEYGISNNPESFVRYGLNSFFTDAKRGAVINLMGNGPQEELNVISEQGMRSWFRDLFISNFNTQKIGGYDPYMNEYVLASNTTLLPTEKECSKCGFNKIITIKQGAAPLTFCVDTTRIAGVITVSFILPTDPVTTIVFGVDGLGYGPFTSTGNFIYSQGATANKSDFIIYNSGISDAVFTLVVSCPAPNDLNVVQVTVGDNVDAGKTITNQYHWVEAATYVAPLQSQQIKMAAGTASPLVSNYTSVVSPQGTGSSPTNSSVLTIASNRTGTDTLAYNLTYNKFRWLASDTAYPNTPTDIAALIAASTVESPTQSNPQLFEGTITMPSNLDIYTYLYLVWDYRVPVTSSLCYSGSTPSDACCSCSCANSTEIKVTNGGASQQLTFKYSDCDRVQQFVTLAPSGSTTVCSDSNNVSFVSGIFADLIQERISCDCCT